MVIEYQLCLGRQRQVWLIPLADEMQGVQVEQCYPLTMCAIPDRLRDASCGGAYKSTTFIFFSGLLLHTPLWQITCQLCVIKCLFIIIIIIIIILANKNVKLHCAWSQFWLLITLQGSVHSHTKWSGNFYAAWLSIYCQIWWKFVNSFRVSEWVSVWMSECVSVRVSECECVWVYEWVYECTSEWVSELVGGVA